jgi:hypothetical protein
MQHWCSALIFVLHAPVVTHCLDLVTIEIYQCMAGLAQMVLTILLLKPAFHFSNSESETVWTAQ